MPSSALTSCRGYFLLLVPILIFMMLVRPYVYQDVVGEGDLVRVANGLLLGNKIGFRNAIDMHYGPSFTYGYYWVIYNVLPPAMFDTAAQVIKFINESGYISAGLILLFGGFAVANLYGYAAAAVMIVLLGFSPMYLELATSGHALLPSTALLCAALCVFQVAESAAAVSIRVLLSLAAGALTFMSLATRSETALALPFLIFAFRDIGFTWSAFLNALVRAVVVTTGFIIFLYLRTYYQRMGGNGSMNSLSGFLSTFYIPRNVIKGAVGLVIACGIVTFTVAGAAFALRFRKQRWAGLVALLLIVPNLVFWLPNGFPVRHFFFALFGAAIFVGVVAQASFPGSAVKPVLGAVLLVVLNQFVAEATSPLVAANYQWNYAQAGSRRSTDQVPLGMFNLNHRTNQASFTELREEGKALAGLKDQHVVVFADRTLYMVLALIDSADDAQVVPKPAPGIAYKVTRGKQTFVLIEKKEQWPEDVAGNYIRTHRTTGTRFYVQPSTRTHYDKTEPPNQASL